jgi:hypothetical protein
LTSFKLHALIKTLKNLTKFYMSECRKHILPDGITERRKVDPNRTILTDEQHAVRALNRFVGPDAKEYFDETLDTKFGGQEADIYYPGHTWDSCGKQFRMAVADILRNPEIRGPIDIKRFVGAHYEEARDLTPLQEGDVSYPSIDDAIKAFADLTPDELRIINAMSRPVFQILPIISTHRYLKDMKSLYGEIKHIELIQDSLKKADERDGTSNDETIRGWDVAISEGDGSAKFFTDSVSGMSNLGKRINWVSENFPNMEMDLKRYFKLFQAEPNGNRLDALDYGQSMTVLNGELDIGDESVPCASSYYPDLEFDMVRLDNRDRSLKNGGLLAFRLSVKRRCV